MSGSKNYQWDYNKPAQIETHSISKLDVISYYLQRYISTLNSSPHQDRLNLTLVDGFCGGGVYIDKHTNDRVYGSPIVIRKAVEAAVAEININRRKPFSVNADYFFIDSEPAAITCLNQVLIDHDYQASSNVFCTPFETKVDEIIAFIKKKGRAHRSIFILDQCGYAKISIGTIRKILKSLNNSEIIITINVESLARYATDKGDQTRQLLKSNNLPDILKNRTLEDIKNNVDDWMLFIQTAFCQELIREADVPFYTPFFIRSGEGQGNYWLLHFSQHYRARDVMASVHWDLKNSFINYAGPGLDMFNTVGFETRNKYHGYLFDDENREISIEAMKGELADKVFSNGNEGILLQTLFATTCNSSPATMKMYKEALFELLQIKDIQIVTESGGTRKVANTISVGDVIKPAQNFTLF